MHSDELRDKLESLHDALAAVDDLDEQTTTAMKQVASDIDRLMQQDSVPSEHVLGVRQRIDDLVLGFESEHPKLASVLSQLTDLLSGMGI